MLKNRKNQKKNKKNKGQYFTTNITLQEKVYQFIQNNPKVILEPSVGRGDLVKYVNSQNDSIEFDCYEIDESIVPIIPNTIIFADFLKAEIDKLYVSIIGNPPYVKTSTGNLYIDFINKCIDLLDINGELILIIPSDFFKLTSALPTLRKMINSGKITNIYHPNSENLFKNACIDVLIFRFQKTFKKLRRHPKVNYNNEELYLIESDGLITFSKNTKKNYKKLDDLFNIHVGIVNGREKIYKNKKFGNIQVLNKENVREKYILLDKKPDENSEVGKFMLKHKNELINRKIRKFNENNWFEWGALRNIETIKSNEGKDCLFVKNLTRDKNICFKGKVEYFGGSLIILMPKFADLNLDKIMKEINNESYQFLYSGRYKIGQRQLSKLLIKYLS